ncbi:Sec-independent protein translocase subunit TatA, partial [Kitasatospora sp. NPDC059327]|uniref:Sec-independent protein translocase subunit TatA n=1 Tax=Kitasatospora sp. NPDC059327 TaxID=3346803 RepID=UPI0036818996
TPPPGPILKETMPMLRNGLEPWHLIVVLAVIVLLFGSKKLPEAARGLGKSLRILKAETRALQEDAPPDTPAEAAQAAQTAPTAPETAVPAVIPAAIPAPRTETPPTGRTTPTTHPHTP